MAASAASAMATAGQAKKKTKKNDDLQHKLRSSAHLHEFVENDRSHVNHFWESVRTSVRASNGCEGMGFRNATKISDLEAADSKTNREEIEANWLIDPDSGNKAFWDFLLAVFVVYTLIGLPVRIAFSIEDPGLETFDYVIDAFFVVDIFVNFNTSYDSTPENKADDMLETSRYKIAKQYAQTWLFIDLIATIPFDSIVKWSGQGEFLSIRLIRIVRMLKLLKFLRVMKMKRILEMLDEINISAGIVSIFVLVLQILLMCHIICCFWYYIATTDAGADPENNWIVKSGYELCVSGSGIEWPDCKSKTEGYVASFYWVMTTMTTVGYGDFRAYSSGERCFACFVIICGSIMFGAVITKVTKLIINRNPQATNLKAKMDDLKGYLNEKNLDVATKEQAIDSYIYYMNKKSLISESGVFDEMPKPMLVKLIQSIYHEEIQTIRVFKKYEDNFVVQIVINSLPFQVRPGEVITENGDIANDVTFIMLGTVSISDVDNKGRKVLTGYCAQGNFFGDFEFLKRSTYIANYTAVHSCNLLSISSQFLSNYLATNIESGLKFTYDVERRYKNYRIVKASPIVESPMNFELTRSRMFFSGEIIDNTDPRIGEIEKADLSNKEQMIRVSRYDSTGERIFVEETAKEIGSRYIILHNGDYKMKWDMFIGMFIVFSVCAIPVEIAFSIEPPTGLYEFETMIDFLFAMDILISSRTTFFDEVNDYTETIPKYMLNHYFRTWFFIDFSSTVPFDTLVTLFVGDGGGGGGLASIRIIKFVRLVRIMKMFRLTKLVSIFNKLENKLGISPAFFELIKYLAIVVFMVHFLSCLWWYASVSFTRHPWFDPSDESSSMYLIDADVGDKYIASLYFTFTTLATVGYGDLYPARWEEQLLDSFIMLIGATIFGYIVASIASLVGGLNRTAAISQARISEITAYLAERSAPRDLTKEIVRYFTHMFEQKTAYDEAGILDRLPKKLKHKIQLMQYGEIIDRIALFNYIENKSVVLYIFENLVLTYFEPNKIIIREGNYANSIMFLIYGKATITKAVSHEILNAKRFRHINNRQREFFNGDKALNKDTSSKDRKSGRRSSSTKNSIEGNHLSRTSSRMGRQMSFFGRMGKEKSAVHAAEEYGLVASGLELEMSEAARGGGNADEASFKKMKDFYTNDPKEDVHVGELAAGQFVGHVAMMSKGGKHSASVISTMPCTFYTLSRPATYRILEDQPCVGLVLEMALGQAIHDLKVETGTKQWWENNKNFLRTVHQKHIKIKTKNALPVQRKRSTTVRPTFRIPKLSFLMSKKSQKRIEEDEVAERRWDKVRTLIKRAWVTAQVSKNLSTKAQNDDGVNTEVLLNSPINERNPALEIFADTVAPSPSPYANAKMFGRERWGKGSDVRGPEQSPPPKRGLVRKQSVFAEVLSYDLGENLEDMFCDVLQSPVEELDRREQTSESVILRRGCMKRNASISSFRHNDDNMPQDIRDGLMEIHHPSVEPSTFRLRRRQTFPAPADLRTWIDDKKHLHVI